MTTARALMRFAFAGLLVNFVAVACVVSDGDDDDDTNSCDPGSFKDCTCADGSEGTRKCNASGSGYGSCVDCAGTGEGGGGGSSTAGTAGAGGESGGESSQGGAGAGGETSGGNAGQGGAAQGGAGGASPDPDAVCLQEAPDECYECAQLSCCEEWKACLEETEGDCEQQFFNIMECARLGQASADVTTEDLEACAQVEVEGGSAWSDGLFPSTKPLIDCTAGQGWAAAGEFGANSCAPLCFLQE